MAWSPFQRANAGIIWVEQPGDYANPIPTTSATGPVAKLPGASSADMRRAIYDRAREAMLTHLRGLHPRMPESDITREEIALNQAIALVEAKFDATEADPATPTPPSRRRPPRGIPIGSKRVRLQGPRSWANLPI